jgi:hypothetical protein
LVCAQPNTLATSAADRQPATAATPGMPDSPAGHICPGRAEGSRASEAQAERW